MKLALPLCLIVLTGCGTAWNPSPVGRGYSSYDEPYKSAPGPEARDIGYDYSTEMNDEIVMKLRSVAQDLLTKLENSSGLPSKNIYLTSTPLPSFKLKNVFVPNNNAFYMSFDHVFREELVLRGYQVVTDPQGATKLQFTARDPQWQNVLVHGEGNAERDLILGLVVEPQLEQPLGQVSGLYNVPAYGYGATFGVHSASSPAIAGKNR